MTLADGKFMKGDTARRAPCVFGISRHGTRECIVGAYSTILIVPMLLMPTVDTTSRRWPSTDRSTEIKKAIKMLSALLYLKKVCVVKAKELRTKEDEASAREKLQG